MRGTWLVGLAVLLGGPARADDGGVALPPLPLEISVDRRPGMSGRSIYVAPQQTPTVTTVWQGGAIAAPLARFGDGLVVPTTRRKLAFVVDAKERWLRPLEDAQYTAPLVAEGILYAGGDDDLVRAFALPQGTPLSTFRAGRCEPRRGVGPTASRCDIEGLARGPDGTLYVAADGLYALGPNFGLRWHYGPAQPTQSGNPVRPVHCLTIPVVLADGTVLVGCDDDNVHALFTDGRPRWLFPAGADVGAGIAVHKDGTIVFGTDEGKLFWLSPDGALLRTLQLKAALRTAPALADSGVAYFVTVEGTLAAINPDATVRWAWRSGARSLSMPLVDGSGTILIGAADSRLYAISPEGVVRWSVLLDGPVAPTTTPLVGPDGTVWIGTVAGSLHAIR